MKTEVTEMENPLEGIVSGLDDMEERMSKLGRQSGRNHWGGTEEREKSKKKWG